MRMSRSWIPRNTLVLRVRANRKIDATEMTK